MSFTPKEFRAIQWYALQHDYTLQLSHRPYVYYSHPKGTAKLRITQILDEYEAMRRQEARERKRNTGQTKASVVNPSKKQ